MTDYDEAYRSTAAFFGEAPDPLLEQHAYVLDPGLEVLDVGCGQGRNALHMASRGLRVTAIDPSPVAIEQVSHQGAARGLRILTMVGGFGDVDLEKGSFGAVMIFGLIPDLPGNLTGPLVRWARSMLAGGGTLWLTGFTTEDPAYPRHRELWETIATNSFAGPDGTVRTYLVPNEILGLVPDHEVVHHWEGLGPEHRHDDGPLERHGRFEAIFRVHA